MKEKTKKIISTVVNVIVWVFLAFALVMMIFALSSAANSNGMPALFGKSFISVQSDSMNPAFKEGDLIICRMVDDKEKAKLSVGDVITMREDLDGDGIKEFKSHRIVAIYAGNTLITDDDGNILPGHEDDYKSSIISYQTQGDNKEMCPTVDGKKVAYADVLCVWNDGDVRIGGLGAFLSFVGSSTGFLIIIVIPLGVFFLYELYNLITIVVQMRQAKAGAGAPVLDEEEIKRRAVEQYLREEELKRQAIEEYKRQQASSSAPEDSTTEENKE